jgi:hypothetical protein
MGSSTGIAVMSPATEYEIADAGLTVSHDGLSAVLHCETIHGERVQLAITRATLLRLAIDCTRQLKPLPKRAPRRSKPSA